MSSLRTDMVRVCVVVGILCVGNARVAAGQAPASAPQGDRAADGLSVFVGPDGSKQPQDLGINANMGIRLGANWAGPVARAFGVARCVPLPLGSPR